jgi:branched-chain amino acid transport system permease protein
MSGYTGQFSFGHAAFFGIGAYATIMAIREVGLSPWVGMLIGAGVAAVVGLLVGGLTFRYELQGHYFALATLAVAELLRYSFNSVPFLGEGSGFFKPFPREYDSEFGLAAFQFQTQEPYFYLIFGFLVFITGVAWVIRSSKLGLYLFAIREREPAAAAVGIPTYRYKLMAFGASAALTAVPGAFWAMYFDTIRPDTVFAILINVEILLPAVVGGLGTVVGPIVGSFVVTPISEYARQSVDLHGLNNIIYGIVLILIVLYSPRGVVSWPTRASELVAAWRRPTGSTDE